MFRASFIIVIPLYLSMVVSTTGQTQHTYNVTNLYFVCELGDIYRLEEGEINTQQLIKDLTLAKDAAYTILNVSSETQLHYKEASRLQSVYEFITTQVTPTIKHPILGETFNVDTFIQTVYHDFVHWYYILSDVKESEHQDESSSNSLVPSYENILDEHEGMLCRLHSVLTNYGKVYNKTRYIHTHIGSLVTITMRYARDVTLLVKLQQYTQQVVTNIYKTIKIIQNMYQGGNGHGQGEPHYQWKHIDDSSPCNHNFISDMIKNDDWISPGHVISTGISVALIDYATRYHRIDGVSRPQWGKYFLEEFPFSFDGLPDMGKFEHIDSSADNTGLYGVIYEDVLRLIYHLEAVRIEEIVANGESMESIFNKLIIHRLLPFACLVKPKDQEYYFSQLWLSHKPKRIPEYRWRSIFSELKRELKCFPPPVSKADVLSNQIVNIRSPEARHWRDLVVLSHTYKYFSRLENAKIFEN